MTSIRIHVEREHSCGQVFEEVLHVESADFSLNTDVPALWTGEIEKLKPFTLPEPPKIKLAFTGTCNKLEVHGMEWMAQHGLVCMKCGAELLFSEQK